MYWQFNEIGDGDVVNLGTLQWLTNCEFYKASTNNIVEALFSLELYRINWLDEWNQRWIFEPSIQSM